MKLDANVLRYLSKDDFRTLTAVEMGQKNHEIVPAQLVDSIAGLKHGGAFKCLKTLLRHKLVHHDSSKYDGYRLTTMGYDFLAIRALVARGIIAGVGRQIGVGKESDVFEVTDDEGNIMALKMHRLGRTSFRAVKSKRDYVRRGSHYSWLYLSRLAAIKEFAFMKALGDAGLPVPKAIDCNRHAVLMSMIDAVPLVQVKKLGNPRTVYERCMQILIQLAGLGLVHCDYNEFNLLINDDEELTLIDFPQMVSTSHANAEELFERDVDGVVHFFERKIGYLPDGDEALERKRPTFKESASQGLGNIDTELRASGFKKEHQSALEEYTTNTPSSGGGSSSSSGGSGSDEEEEEERVEDTTDDEERIEVAVEEGISGSSDINDDNEMEEDDDDKTDDDDDSQDNGDNLIAGVSTLHVSKKKNETSSQPQQSVVQQRVIDQQKKAARRTAMASASRNAAKPKNKGKRKGVGNGGGLEW